ncbi:hypothetical protein E6R62_05895 [Streptomyces sp. A1136]|nr:hypothetical protein E6R62_05895 [Streptomyces sp. A1136]
MVFGLFFPLWVGSYDVRPVDFLLGIEAQLRDLLAPAGRLLAVSAAALTASTLLTQYVATRRLGIGAPATSDACPQYGAPRHL